MGGLAACSGIGLAAAAAAGVVDEEEAERWVTIRSSRS